MDLPKLIGDLKSADPVARAAAAEELARAGEAAQSAAVELVRATADDDSNVRDWAVAALEGIGPPSPQSTSVLAELLADSRIDVAYWSATLLGRLGANGLGATGSASAELPVALRELIVALNAHPEIAVRQRAAWALGQHGPSANNSETISALKKTTTESDPRLARLAAQAIEQIGGE